MCIQESLPRDAEHGDIHLILNPNEEREGDLVPCHFRKIVTVEDLEHRHLPRRLRIPSKKLLEDTIAVETSLCASSFILLAKGCALGMIIEMPLTVG